MQEFLFLPHFPEHPINGGLPDPHLDEAPQQNMFNERKVAQMAAFLLSKQDGRMPHLKLMKLLYLAERESLNHDAIPMSGDRLVSMEHGPVLSHTLNHMDGDIESSPDGWGEYISSKENYELSLKKAVTRRELEELSDADIAILDRLWGKFGHMSKWQIRDWTHK
ncbi:MAG: SocA family protein, partial [Bacteroidetes bacterium]|nr:SocA family protein [Bacteroidota bacterium]